MSTEWYLYKDGQQHGPVSWDQLRQQAASRQIDAEDQVWTESMSGWTRAAEVEGLFGSRRPAATAPAPPPRSSRPQPQPAPVDAAWAAGSMAGAYPKAPMGRRFLAYFIDGLIASVPMTIIGVIVSIGIVVSADASGDPSALVMVLAFGGGLLGFAWALGYTLLRDGMGSGQSLGKKMFKLMVVRLEDGRPCTKGNSAVRNLIGGVLGFIDIIVALVGQTGQRVGDKLVNAQVIEVEAWERSAY